jgi:hypothetical protein
MAGRRAGGEGTIAGDRILGCRTEGRGSNNRRMQTGGIENGQLRKLGWRRNHWRMQGGGKEKKEME